MVAGRALAVVLAVLLLAEGGRATAHQPGQLAVGGNGTAAGPGGAGRPQASALDRLFEEFWSQDSPRDAARVAERLIREELDFEEALARLEQGRRYAPGADTGEVRWISPYSPRVGVRTIVLVPRDYDAAQRYPVRIQLNVGASRNDPLAEGLRRRLQSAIGTRYESTRATIHVLTSGFADAQWWAANQVDNLHWIVDRLKRTYNVDENHVHLIGEADGGTGTLFLAMRDTTPWSAVVSLNGHPRVLSSPQRGVDGELFAGNLSNKPLYLVNGGRDQFYPAATVAPFVDLFRRAGADATFRVKSSAGHETTWWAEEQFDVDDFVDTSERDPLPSRVSWETERVDRYNRAHWVVITRLGPRSSDAELADVNDLSIDGASDFGLRLDLQTDRGRRIMDVIRGSDADRAGLRVGDTIVEVDGKRTRDGQRIAELVAEGWTERAIGFAVEREGRRVELTAPFPRAQAESASERAFPRTRPSGRVDVVQRGNVVEARTRGVEAFTLLLSPRRFDFTAPIVVHVNGREVVRRTIAPDVATLLRWAALDNDRTMLFGAELPIEVP